VPKALVAYTPGDSVGRDGEQELMFRAAAGDGDAFAQVYERFHQAVREFVLRRRRAAACSCVSADDLTQEVFSRSWAQRAQFRGQSSVRTYLLAIAVNVLHEERRRLAKAPESGHRIEDVFTTTNDDENRTELAEHLLAAISRLPRLEAEAVALFHLRDLPCEPAAKIAGCTIEAFRRRLQLARQRLQILLAPEVTRPRNRSSPSPRPPSTDA
jgi:RNA polymerase sigma-70 factor (ECF subfamily)